jgi:hypothetical protein
MTHLSITLFLMITLTVAMVGAAWGQAPSPDDRARETDQRMSEGSGSR